MPCGYSYYSDFHREHGKEECPEKPVVKHLIELILPRSQSIAYPKNENLLKACGALGLLIKKPGVTWRGGCRHFRLNLEP